MKADTYFIKEGYKINIENGRPKLEYKEPPKGDKYQFHVFKEIRNYIKNHQECKAIVDLGCGSGFKLNHFLKDLAITITGIDQGFSVERGSKTYPFIKWIEDDFSKPSYKTYGKFDLIISSDVIEHLVNPNFLLDRIKECATPNSIVFLSTPERDLVRGTTNFGPSDNPKHVREWNKVELANYVKSYGFFIIDHKVLEAKKLSLKETLQSVLGLYKNKTCQLVIFKINE